MESEAKPTEEEIKQEYIRQFFDEERSLASATAEELETYKKYIQEGVKKKWIIALYAVAYGCYGGNEIFKCDWVKSRDTLLEIIALQGDADPFIYNTLGYIYYYGRCTDGKPDYDLAFKYFSVGAANGVYESIYKSADMFINGKGVPKSEKAGAKLILSIYEENRDNFCNEIFDSKFADVALRTGGLYENGIGLDKDISDAFYHYCEAKYAIDFRLKQFDLYGDKKVRNNIEEAYNRTKALLPEDYFVKEYCLNHPGLIGFLLTNGIALDITLSNEGNDYFLTAERYASEDMGKNVLLNIPEASYCRLLNKIKLRLQNAIVIDTSKLPERAFIDSIVRSDEEENTWLFCYREMTLMQITCTGFIFVPDN